MSMTDISRDIGLVHAVQTSKDIQQHYSEVSDDVASNTVKSHQEYYGLIIPTAEEKRTLRKVAGKMPSSAYYLCIVEFAERASYFGCSQVYKNFIRGGLPVGGNGAGAPPRGSQLTAGALHRGSIVATAMTQAFQFLAYGLPLFFGWLADTKWGRFKTICVGVAVCGVAHIIMVISAIPSVLATGNAIGPFALSLYMLAIGAAMFKANISPTIMDQSPHKIAHVITDEKTGDKVIVDPEESLNSVMLWFYLLINVGACFGIPTAYLAKLVGFWSAFLLPGIVYFVLPPLLWYLNKKLIKQPPGGSDLSNIMKLLSDIFAHGGIFKIFRKGFWESAKPTNRRANGSNKQYTYDDQFVNDVRRTFQACGIFLFFPIFNINDGGLGAATNALSASLTTNGVPNDVLDNLSAISIIIGKLSPIALIFSETKNLLVVPIMNHVIYPLLRKRGIRWGPISRITFGFALCSIGSIPLTVLQYFVYQTSPCGYNATHCADLVAEGESSVSPISIGFYAIPTILTSISEIFVVVTAYSIAYSRSPKNMKGLVASLNLFTSAISAVIGLVSAPAIDDPNLIWAFAGPTIAGGVLTVVFWFTFRHLNDEDFVLNTDVIEPKNGRDLDSDDAEVGEAKNRYNTGGVVAAEERS